MSECLLFIRLLHHRGCLAASDTHVGRGDVLTDYRLIACTTAGRRPQSSVTLEPGQLSPQPTLDTANVFVFNQLLSNIVVNM